MRISRRTSVILLSLSLVMVMATTVSAMEQYPEKLPDKGINHDCQYCHFSKNGGGDINDFGQDFKDNDFTYDDTLADMDSDGDGFLNGEEFDNKPVTNPGDPDSFPDPEGEEMQIQGVLIGIFAFILIGLIAIWRPKAAPQGPPPPTPKEGGTEEE